jgi:hypothetical protein
VKVCFLISLVVQVNFLPSWALQKREIIYFIVPFLLRYFLKYGIVQVTRFYVTNFLFSLGLVFTVSVIFYSSGEIFFLSFFFFSSFLLSLLPYFFLLLSSFLSSILLPFPPFLVTVGMTDRTKQWCVLLITFFGGEHRPFYFFCFKS